MADCAVMERDKPCVWFRHHLDACAESTCSGCMPNLATHGHYCDKHHDRVGEALRALPQRHHDLGQWLEPGAGETKGQPRVSGTVAIRSPLNTNIADHRAHTLRLLRGYAALEQQTRSNTPQLWYSAHQLNLSELTPHNLANWLHTRLNNISQRHWAPEFAAAIIAADKRAYGLTHPDGRTTKTIGDCPENDCAGQVTIQVNPSKTIEADTDANCDTCNKQWPSGEWRHLADRMDTKQATWISPQLIAQEHNLALTTIYNYASRHQWRRRQHPKRPGLIAYWLEDVTATFNTQQQAA